MTSTRRTGHVAAAVVLLSISACGSSQSNARPTTTATSLSASTVTGLGAAFKTRAATLCAQATNKLLSQGPFPYPNFDPEHPDPSDLPGIADYEAKTVTTERAWQAGLLALGDPVSGATGWSALLAAVNRELQGTVAQQEAAQRGDTAMFTKTFHDLTSYGLPGTQAAAAISLASCDPGNLANPNATAPVPVRRP
jgi:hypothetical protein